MEEITTQLLSFKCKSFQVKKKKSYYKFCNNPNCFDTEKKIFTN